MGGNSNLQSTTINAPDNQKSDLPMLSPYAGNGSWASMVRSRRLSFVNSNGTIALTNCLGVDGS
jgi:hypothetical protein